MSNSRPHTVHWRDDEGHRKAEIQLTEGLQVYLKRARKYRPGYDFAEGTVTKVTKTGQVTVQCGDPAEPNTVRLGGKYGLSELGVGKWDHGWEISCLSEIAHLQMQQAAYDARRKQANEWNRVYEQLGKVGVGNAAWELTPERRSQARALLAELAAMVAEEGGN